MRKLSAMKMRVYRNRVVELNNFLERFPTAFSVTQKIDDDEIVDILEFGTPNKWQSEMVHLGLIWRSLIVRNRSSFVNVWSSMKI